MKADDFHERPMKENCRKEKKKDIEIQLEYGYTHVLFCHLIRFSPLAHSAKLVSRF